MNKQTAEAPYRYYDESCNSLVYIGQSATAEMWDSLWAPTEEAVRAAVKNDRGTRWVVELTRRYLPRGGRILEGGCALGYNVAALRRAGYETVGLDFAPATVSMLQRVAPELPILLGDVRALPFPDHAFSGYWSLGVIEHFYSGYEPLAAEAARVVRPGGFLFLTFPYMSPLRRLRARWHRYPRLHMTEEPPGFYQFALEPRRVIANFERLGFRKRYQISMSGLQGMKDELGWIGHPLQSLHAYNGTSLFLRAVRAALERFAPIFGTGHSCVMVLQKQTEPSS